MANKIKEALNKASVSLGEGGAEEQETEVVSPRIKDRGEKKITKTD